VYGEDSVPLKEKRVAGVQTLSGTGGLRVFGEVLHQFGHTHIYVVSSLALRHLSSVRESVLTFAPLM
jgi:aspartate/tyrosine/aromatic aminotransferase